ncbi:hypothetical protein V6N11_030948 [Hibiscus sabdariffa]|uniref:Uncharacterized protein n=1 Tax=Hibiscus sabdariffa TaxID=183260 RepID=A0ABR2NSD3_9ROSI
MENASPMDPNPVTLLDALLSFFFQSIQVKVFRRQRFSKDWTNSSPRLEKKISVHREEGKFQLSLQKLKKLSLHTFSPLSLVVCKGLILPTW